MDLEKDVTRIDRRHNPSPSLSPRMNDATLVLPDVANSPSNVPVITTRSKAFHGSS